VNITLQIDRLVLDGIPVPHDAAPQVQAAVEQELTRLLAEGGIGPALLQGTSVYAIRTGDIHVAANDGHADLGRRIAGTLYGGIGQ
jgi:hypothetical protein